VTLPKLSEEVLRLNCAFPEPLAARAYVPEARKQTASRSTLNLPRKGWFGINVNL
jgi:hypothetical protein